ncbi:MAG TPA: hypothetical protein VFG79_22775 [Solirubrobacter sp.]|nr:hypothetical protein [Solirubrobacter sp.]
MRSTPIDFHKDERGRYHSILHRSDGVLIRLEGGSYNRIGGADPRVPHDIAHLVVEHAFGLDAGLWGTLAAGGLVQNATFAGGRKPPHAEKRAWAITDRAGETLRQAELLVRAVADAMLEGSGRNLRPDAFERASAGLRAAAARWQALGGDDTLRLTWPPA